MPEFEIPFDVFYEQEFEPSLQPALNQLAELDSRLLAAEAALNSGLGDGGGGSTPNTSPPTISLSGPSPLPTLTQARVFDVMVSYASANGIIDRSTLAGIVRAVRTSNGSASTLLAVGYSTSLNASAISVLYRLNASGYDSANNGSYQLRGGVGAGDTDGNSISTEVSLGTFSVNIPTDQGGGGGGTPVSDSTPPTISVSAADIFADVAAHQFELQIEDTESSIAGESVDDDAIRVTGPSSFDKPATLISKISPAGNGNIVTAVYEVAGPFVAADNGTYSINAVTSGISDDAGIFVPAGPVGTFLVNISAGLDEEPPTVESNGNP